MSRHELIAVVKHQAGQIAELFDTNEVLTAMLARLEHLLSGNSRNSSLPPSKDDDLGKAAPEKPQQRDGGGPKRQRGKQPGAPGGGCRLPAR